MTGGTPIRARRMLQDTPIDPVQVGGIGWNLIEKKFGFYDGTQFCWYPGIDPVLKMMIMNTGQRLGGRDNTGAVNPIVLSFEKPNTLEFIDTSTNTVIAAFSALGATFANGVPGNALPGGSLQRVSHPGFLPNLFSSSYITSATPGFVGPNTYLWAQAANSGSAQVRYNVQPGSGAFTNSSTDNNVLEFTANGQISGIGLRSWFFDPSLAYDGVPNTNRHFISIYGPLNQLNTIRVGRAGVYTNLTVMGTGAWQRVAVDIPVHQLNQSYAYNAAYEPYAVDWFYNTTGGTWFIAEPTVQNINVYPIEFYQNRSLAERLASADAYYWQPPTQYIFGNQFLSLALPTSCPIVSANATYDVIVNSSDYAVTVTEKTQQGFTINTVDTNATTLQWKANLKVGYRGPLTDIS